MVRTGCKYIGLHSGWNKTKSGLSGVLVTYLKINFELGPNVPRAESDEIQKFRPVQTSEVGFAMKHRTYYIREVPSSSLDRITKYPN
jgi:hypothetical protein